MLIYNPAFHRSRPFHDSLDALVEPNFAAANRTVTSDADGTVTVGVDQRGGAPWHTNWHAVT